MTSRFPGLRILPVNAILIHECGGQAIHELSFALAMGQELATRARQMEEKGQAAAARSLLLAATREAPNDAVAATIAAEFLERHGDPAARGVYEKLTGLLEKSGSPELGKYAKRLVALDLLAGDLVAAQKHARMAGGLAVPSPRSELGAEFMTIDIPDARTLTTLYKERRVIFRILQMAFAEGLRACRYDLQNFFKLGVRTCEPVAGIVAHIRIQAFR